MSQTFLLNFGHGIAPSVLEQLQPCQEIRVPFPYIGKELPTSRLVTRAVNLAERKMRTYGGALDGSVPVILILPGTTEGGVVLVSEVAGRLGCLPRVLALRKSDDGTYRLFGGTARTGVLDLERVKLAGRGRRGYQPAMPEEARG